MTILLGIFTMRSRLALLPSKRQTIGEAIYEIAQTQVAAAGPADEGDRPLVPVRRDALLFIFTVNLLGFIPLPLTGETWHGVPTWGIYAATSQLSVTLALALLTFVFTHVEGIRWNGLEALLQELGSPRRRRPLLLADRPARDPRPVLAPHLAQRQALREHARRPHPDPQFDRPALHPQQPHVLDRRGLPVADRIAFYIFEVVIVVTIQAFIFAALSAIYIGSAIEPDH